jgi:hypothetical protein
MELFRSIAMTGNRLPKEKGQALTEFALVFGILLTMLLLAMDPFFYAANLAVSKLQSFYASREASIYLAGDGRTCEQAVNDALGNPSLFNVSSTGLFFGYYPDPDGGDDISQCPNFPSWVPPTGQQVTATFIFSMNTIFWGGTWDGSMSTTDIFR